MDNKEITFTVPLNEANTILAALAKQPYEIVAGLIGRLQAQAQAQLQTQPAADPAKE